MRTTQAIDRGGKEGQKRGAEEREEQKKEIDCAGRRDEREMAAVVDGGRGKGPSAESDAATQVRGATSCARATTCHSKSYGCAEKDNRARKPQT